MINFFIKGEIPSATHQQKKVTVRCGKPILYEPANLKVAREYYMLKLKHYAPKEPLKGAVYLATKWIYKRPLRGKNKGLYKTTKPDTDNLVKLLKDCMTACGFWQDDAQVAVEVVEKVYGDVEGIVIKIKELEV